MSMIQIFRRYYFPVFGIYAAIAAAVFAIAMLLFPEDRTNLFWISLGIAELFLTMPFLTLANLAYPKDESVYGHRIAAVVPVLFGGVILYITAMFVLLAVNAFVYDLGRLGLMLHIVMSVCFIVFAFALQLAAAGAEQGTEAFQNPVDSPATVAAMIQSAEQRLAMLKKDFGISAALKALREDLTYKLPSAGKITGSEMYRTFAAKVRALTEKFQQPELDEAVLQALKTEAELLRTEIPVIQQAIR